MHRLWTDNGPIKSRKLFAVLFCLLFIGVGSAWGAKITDYTKIVSGKAYRIGATISTTDYYFQAQGGITTGTGKSGVPVTSAADATTVIITGSGTSWTIQFTNGNYMYLQSTESNGQYSVQESSATWSFSNESSLIRMTINTKTLQRNNSAGTSRFGSYAASQTDVWLEEVPEYTVNWSVNGTTWTGALHGSPSTSAYSGTQVSTIPTAPTSSECDGNKVFVGWSASSIATTTNTRPTDLFTTATTSPTITANTTFYAVFANKFSRVTSTSDLANGASFVICHISDNQVLKSDGSTISTASAPAEDGSGKISPTAEMIWTLESSSTNWKFKYGPTNYLKGDANPTSSSKTKTISMNTSGNLTWVIGSSSYTTNAFYIRNSSGANAGLEYYNGWKLYYGTAANIASQASWGMKLYVSTAPAYATSCCTKLGSINGSFW